MKVSKSAAALITALMLGSTTSFVAVAPAVAEATQNQAELETQLQARIDKFNQDFAGNNYEGVVEVMPPKILVVLAEQNDMTVEQLQEMLPKFIEGVMSEATVHSFAMADAEGKVETVDGLHYALLPTSADMSVGGNRAATETTTVALYDDGKWYLARIDTDAQEQQLKEVYPQLGSVKLR